jgi:HrpA-like RNA helicase
MALLPLNPAWSHTLLLAPQFGRVVEALTCVAPLSVEPCS